MVQSTKLQDIYQYKTAPEVSVILREELACELAWAQRHQGPGWRVCQHGYTELGREGTNRKLVSRCNMIPYGYCKCTVSYPKHCKY